MMPKRINTETETKGLQTMNPVTIPEKDVDNVNETLHLRAPDRSSSPSSDINLGAGPWYML